MPEFSISSPNTNGFDPTQASAELTARAEDLFAEGSRLVTTDTTDPGRIRETLHLVVPVEEEQVKPRPFSDYVGKERTVTRLRTMALRRTTGGGEPSYDITDIDPDDRGSDERSWAEQSYGWGGPYEQPVQRGRGVDAAGPTQSERSLVGLPLKDLVDTLRESQVWDSGRQTVLSTANGDRLVSRKALVGLRRALAFTHDLMVSGWHEKY